MTEPLLNLQQLQVSLATPHGDVHAIDGASFSVAAGETFALLGESGCGKSMTALSILQLLPPNAYVKGRLCFDDTDMLQLPEVALRGIRGRRISIIFQEPMTSLNPIMRIGDQIGEVLKAHTSLNYQARQQRVEALLTDVGIGEAKQRSRQYPHELSGGMKQRVMIALALAVEPDLLIADEPTTALDVTIQAQILKLLKDLQQKTKMGILLITHDLAVVRQVADRVGVMYAGHLVELATSERFFSQPRHPYSQQLFAALPSLAKREQNLAVIKGQVPDLTQSLPPCRYADRCPYVWSQCYEHSPKWLSAEEEQFVRCHLYDSNIPQAEKKVHVTAAPSELTTKKFEHTILLTARDIKVHFPIKKGLFKRTVAVVKAVDGVDLTLKKGQTLALVGESGCGKTTLGRALLRLVPTTAGEVTVNQQDILKISSRRMKKIRRHMQMIFQDPFSSMNPRMMVADIIAEGLRAMGLSKVECQQRVAAILPQVGLTEESMTRYPHEFSGGQRQRICIARALVMNPDIIICDEPTSALDVSVQAQIINLLKQLQQQHGLSYLFISHNISVVAYLADEIAVMYSGRIVEQGPVDDIINHPQHPYTKTLLAAVPTVEQPMLSLTGL